MRSSLFASHSRPPIASERGTKPLRPLAACLGAVRRRHLAEAGEAEVDLRHAAGVAGCPKAALGMAPVDPAGAQPDLVRRLVVVEEALRSVQDLALLDAEAGERLQHVREVPLA